MVKGSIESLVRRHLSFSQGQLDEWQSNEHFSSQPEIDPYLPFVVDKFDLKRDKEYIARVATVSYHEADKLWNSDP